MTELKTLKYFEHPAQVMMFDREVELLKKNGINPNIVFVSDLRAEAVKIIKKLKKVDTSYYKCYDPEENLVGMKRDKDFLDTFGFELLIDDEYSWTDDIIECLIKFIMWQNNLTEEDLK